MKQWQERQVLEARELRKDFLLHPGGMGRDRRVVQAVERASLALYAGRALALVGESGSGKTTIARMLAGMHAPTQGELRFEGRPVNLKSVQSMKHYRRNVQYVFQDPFSSLNPVHSVRHHLLRPLKLHGHVQGTGEREMQVLLEKVNLTPARQFLDKYPHQLSGGQRQRVAIARALAVQPVVLLADEPVSMLDVSLRLDVLNLLLRLKEEDGLAFLFITHDIASARYFAEETQVMYAGQVVEGGPAEQVIGQPKHPYTRLLCAAAPDPARALRQVDQGEVGAQNVAERGEPPDLVRPPGGCRFHPRCPHAMAVCRQRLPARTTFGDGHWTRCFLYSQGEDASCL
ncbi:MAG TPA: ABC transporter ATP-binding protein [Ktedonobacteraceae bacterium]|jgi:peptide/nickel transport system ATP-binding protein